MFQHSLYKRVGIEETSAHFSEILALFLLVPVRTETGHRRKGKFLPGVFIYESVELDDRLFPCLHDRDDLLTCYHGRIYPVP